MAMQQPMFDHRTGHDAVNRPGSISDPVTPEFARPETAGPEFAGPESAGAGAATPRFAAPEARPPEPATSEPVARDVPSVDRGILDRVWVAPDAAPGDVGGRALPARTYVVRVGHARITVEGCDRQEAIREARRLLALDLPRMWDVIYSLDEHRFDIASEE